MFDPAWAENGHQEAVVTLFTSWVAAQNVPGLQVEVLREAGRTPLIFMELPASGGGGNTVLLYGHLDKQVGGHLTPISLRSPERDGWAPGWARVHHTIALSIHAHTIMPQLLPPTPAPACSLP